MTKEASLKSPRPALDGTPPVTGQAPEDEVCSVPTTESCEVGANKGSEGTADPHPPPLPVPASPSSQDPKREPAPSQEESCTRGPRSLVDVLDSLL